MSCTIMLDEQTTRREKEKEEYKKKGGGREGGREGGGKGGREEGWGVVPWWDAISIGLDPYLQEVDPISG